MASTSGSQQLMPDFYGLVIRMSSKPLKYTNKQNIEMSYFNAVVMEIEPDGTVPCTNATFKYLQIYKKDLINYISPGLKMHFKNVVKKTEVNWYIVAESLAITTGFYEITSSLEVQTPPLPENFPEGGLIRQLTDALMTNYSSTVMGKIVKLSPVKTLPDGLTLRHVGLKDESGLVKVALFEKDAAAHYIEGQTLKISHCYRKVFGTDFLNTKKGSRTNPVSDADLDKLTITPDDLTFFDSDDDFIPDNTDTEEFEISALKTLCLFQQCDKIGCRQVVKDEKCPACGPAKKSSTNIRVDLEIKMQNPVTIYKSELKQIFIDFPEMTSSSERKEFVVFIAKHLPLRVRACLQKDGRLSKIVVKRKDC